MWTLIFVALKIISPISVRLSVRIKRKLFVFNRVRLFYFKEKPATHLRHGSKNMKKHMFWGKNLFVRRFLLEWKLLRHLWKRKKMRKTYTTWWTLGWGIAVVSLPLWKGNKGYKETERETGRKMLREQLSSFSSWKFTTFAKKVIKQNI